MFCLVWHTGLVSLWRCTSYYLDVTHLSYGGILPLNFDQQTRSDVLSIIIIYQTLIRPENSCFFLFLSFFIDKNFISPLINLFRRHGNLSSIILYQEVRESSSVYNHIVSRNNDNEEICHMIFISRTGFSPSSAVQYHTRDITFGEILTFVNQPILNPNDRAPVDITYLRTGWKYRCLISMIRDNLPFKRNFCLLIFASFISWQRIKSVYFQSF